MQTINLDLSTKSVIPLLNVKQMEVGRKFKASITEDGNPYSLAGVVFSVWYSGTSGEGNYTNIGDASAFSVSGNNVTVELITQMLTNAGKGTLCLVMNTASGDQIATWNIPYYVETVPGAGSQEATNYYNAFQKVLEDLPYPDTTLSIPGKAADAAVVGKALNGITYLGKGEDVDRLITPGRYACETDEIAKTLLGCPVEGPFTLDVRYANGKAPHVGQELKPAGKGARLYRQFVKYPEILSEEANALRERVRKVSPEEFIYIEDGDYGATGEKVNIYSGDSDTSWYSDEASTFELDTAAKLYGLAQLVNGGKTFAGKTVKLTKDIVINEGVASAWGENAPTYSWTPIGAAVDSINSWKFINHFAGTLDGQGHYISGLYNVQGRDNGFMCYTVNATINNLAIINSYFENEGVYMSATKPDDAQVLGTFVGRGYGITLKNLYTNAILVCTGNDYHTGGIAGFAKSGGSVSDKKSPAVTHNFGPATIDSVVFEGSIQTTVAAGSLVGGILGGTDNSYAAIVNSLFAGAINTNDSHAGGIVGRISEYSKVDGCVAVGSINTKTKAGGIVGQLYLNKAEAGLFTITDCHYDLEIDLKVYGSTYNNSGGMIQVDDSGSKKLSAECKANSMVPTKWAKVHDSENAFTPEIISEQNDPDGKAFEARLNALLAGMEWGETKQIVFNNYPVLNGSWYSGTLFKGPDGYAALTGVTYDGVEVTKQLYKGVWYPFSWVQNLNAAPLRIGGHSSVRFRLDANLLMFGRVSNAGRKPVAYVFAAYSKYRQPTISELSNEDGTGIDVSDGGSDTEGWYVDIYNGGSGEAIFYMIGSAKPEFI